MNDPAANFNLETCHEKTTLYRLFKNQELLYVGISSNYLKRFDSHRRQKDWWFDVDRITTEHFETRTEAEQAEKYAIKAEKPKFNIVHNGINQFGKTKNSETSKSNYLKVDGYSLKSYEFLTRDKSGMALVGTLWLYPEISCTSVLCDYWVNGLSHDEILQIVFNYLKKHHSKSWKDDAIPIDWFVRGALARPGSSSYRLIHEFMPFNDDKNWPNKPDFLTYFDWPRDYRGQIINFLNLPIVNDRFPKFAEALGWMPSPLQKTAPLRSIYEIRNSINN